MRKYLDALYALSGLISALFIAAIFVVMIGQAACNFMNRIWVLLTGAHYGLAIPSYADFSGYFLACATCFALASTFQSGSQLRVTLLLGNMRPGLRRVPEVFALGCAAALCIALTWFLAEMTFESLRFGDVSTGTVPIKIWIPQSMTTLGFIVFSICLMDALVTYVSGETPEYLLHEDETTTSE